VLAQENAVAERTCARAVSPRKETQKGATAPTAASADVERAAVFARAASRSESRTNYISVSVTFLTVCGIRTFAISC
jgi:hypothetical protein